MKINIFNIVIKYFVINKGKFNFYLISFYLLSVGSTLFSQSTYQGRIIDSESNIGVPFAYVQVAGKNIVEVSDQNGFFSLPILHDDSIQISHIGYKTIKTTFTKIKDRHSIKLSELPVEIKPVFISATSAESLVNNAIDSSFKALYTPMYFRCFRKDLIKYEDTLVAEASAEIFYTLEHLFSPSHGGLVRNHLINIMAYRNPIFKSKIIPRFDMPASFAPFNRYIIGVAKNAEKKLYFFKQEVNDSILEISLNPRFDYTPNKRAFLKSGRFIINKRTGKIIQIDLNLSPELTTLSRSEYYHDKNAKRYFYQYSFSETFNFEGLISRVFWNLKFSYLEDNPQKIWENKSEIIFIHEKYLPTFTAKELPLKLDSTLIQMNSRFELGFENKFEKMFPNN